MIILVLASCSVIQQKSNIVTSKDQALKAGNYSYSEKPELIKEKQPKPTKQELKALARAKETKIKDSIEAAKYRTIVEEQTPENFTPTFEVGDYIKEQIINVANENLGVPYQSGGTSPSGFDCSGFVLYALKPFDISLPRTSSDMAKTGKRILKKDAKRGDLIFFNTSGSGVSHVGLVTGVEGDVIKFIHSSSSNGVINSSTAESYYAKNFVQVNRILE